MQGDRQLSEGDFRREGGEAALSEVACLQPLDIAGLERNVLRVSHSESDDICYHVDITATARLRGTACIG